LLLNLILGFKLVNGPEIDSVPLPADVVQDVAEPDAFPDNVAIEVAGLTTDEPTVEEIPEHVPEGLEVVSATVRHSLARTFQDAVSSERSDVVAAVYARLFFWKLDVRRDLQAGDDVQMVYEWDGKLAHIPAATYYSQKHGTQFAAYHFKATGDAYASWWDEDGNEVSYRLNDSPLTDYEQVTALLKDRPRHRGMDFKTPVGTPVYSPRAGKVTRVNWNLANNGNCIEVRYRDGVVAKYLHLSETSVRAGTTIAKGAVLGNTGNTGHSTAPHLHYEIEKAGKVLDPVDYHGVTQRSLPAGDREVFGSMVLKYKSWLSGDS
jgi:murein DD-endopeptidase MepM/ murein hydrolase activator NlpD